MLMDDIEVKVYRSGIKIPVIFFVPATAVLTVYVLVYLLVNSQLFLDETMRQLDARLPGQFEVAELVVEPTLTEFHIWGINVADRYGERFIHVDRIHAGLDPLPLLVRRVDVDFGTIDGASFDQKFEPGEDGRMNLLDAFGLLDRPTNENPDAEAPVAGVSLRNLKCNDCRYSLQLDAFEFEVPHVDIEHAEVDAGDGLLLIRVPELLVEQADFEFRHWLFYYPPEKGNWRFTARNFHVTNWKWAGDGFVVDDVKAEVGGVELAATGQMTFPDVDEDEDQSMMYRARGTVDIPPWTRTGQYFIDDLFHVDTRTLDIRVEGTMDTIEGETKFDIGMLDAYGVQVTDLSGTAALNDQIVSIDQASGHLHGGTVDITDGWFDMFDGYFGGLVAFADVDPRGVAGDIVAADYPYLEGRATGELEVLGQIEFDEEYGRDTSPFVALNQFLDHTVQLRLPTPTTLVRTGALDTLPGRSFEISAGTQIWATPDRLGVENAEIIGDHFALEIDDFIFDWERYELRESQYGRHAKLRLTSNSIGRLLDGYGASGLDGRLVATLDPIGMINYPTTGFDVRVSQPRLTVSGVDVEGEQLVARGTLSDGRVRIDDLRFESEDGGVAAKGFVDVLRDPRGMADERGEIVTDFLYPRRHPANLTVQVSDLDLAAADRIGSLGLELEGRANGTLNLRDTIEDPEASFEVALSNASILGQDLRRAELRGEIADRTWQLQHAVIDAGGAGRIKGWANIGFDESLAFEATGEGIDLAEIAALRDVGVSVTGRSDFYFHGAGTLDAPIVGGDARVEDIAVGDRPLGDLALVANTIGDTTHLVGALLPWVTVDIEVPLDGESSYYARFGIDHLDVVDAIPELQNVPALDEVEATGTIEVFLEPGFERYQVLANLSEIRAVALDKTFRNEGPVIAGLNNGELFQVQQATIGTEDRFVSIQGGIFLDEALIDVQLQGDLDLSLLTGFRLSFPEFFPDSFLESRGVATVDASVKGTPGLLVADGFVDFGNTEVLLRDISDPLQLLSGRVVFNRSSISIDPNDPLRGRILGGMFSATGDLGLDGMTPRDIRAKIWTHNMSYRIPETANLTFDTALRLSAPDLDRPETWELAGNVDILDGLYYENISIFQEQLTNRLIGAFSRKTERYEASFIDQFPALEEMSFDLAVRARDGFRIESEIDRLALDLELRIDVRLRNTLVDPQLNGDIDVIDGRVTFQGEAFDVRTGTLSFFGDLDNPYVDVIAEADIFNTCRDTDVTADVSQTMSLSGVVDTTEQKSYHITLNVQGALDKLDVQFESTPYADERDILSLLLTGCTVDQLTASSASSPTLEVALGPVLGWIEGQVQDVVEVEEFTITPSVDRLKATVGDSISRRLSWRLQLDTGLTEVATGQRLQLEYKLSDRWSAQASESSTESSQFDSFLLDFKLKYRILLD